MIEGLYLFQIGLSPYSGTVFHQAPLLLPLLSPFLSPSLPPILLRLFFVAMDIAIGIVLFGVAMYYVNDDVTSKPLPPSPSSITPSFSFRTMYPTRRREESWFSENPYALAALYPSFLSSSLPFFVSLCSPPYYFIVIF